jgi:hypothetical protein
MRRHALDLALLFALATAAAVFVAVGQPGVRGIVVHVYVLVVGALLMLGLVTATSESAPRRTRGELERALAERDRTDRPLPELERALREVTLATATAYDFHRRLLPGLRTVAQSRLERRGLPFTEAYVGRWWDLLRPDREPPDERFAPGMPPAELRALVDDLERI